MNLHDISSKRAMRGILAKEVEFFERSERETRNKNSKTRETQSRVLRKEYLQLWQ